MLFFCFYRLQRYFLSFSFCFIPRLFLRTLYNTVFYEKYREKTSARLLLLIIDRLFFLAIIKLDRKLTV
jgi:hypothetical protein